MELVWMVCDDCGQRKLCEVIRPNPEAPAILALCETCSDGDEE